MSVSHGSLRRFLETFPGWFGFTRTQKAVFVRFVSDEPVAKAQVAVGTKEPLAPKRMSESEWIDCVAKIVIDNNGTCRLSRIGGLLKQMGLVLPSQYRTLTELLKIGVQRGRFVMAGSEGTLSVSVVATTVSVVPASVQSGSTKCLELFQL